MGCVTLSNVVRMPQVGFGTYRAGADGKRVVLDAIDVGYRLIDTAWNYGTEPDVGRAIAECGVPREELFVTTKVSRNHLGYRNCKRLFAESLERLGLDYVDLYLIHWPRPSYGRPDWDDWQRLDRETWRAMEELYHEGKVRAIGVSNFFPEHLDSLMLTAEVAPMVNQLELHPGYMQEDVVAYCRDMGMAIEAYSPNARGRLANDPVLLSVADAHGTSVTHVCLSYLLQKQIVILPKSAHRNRMEENLDPTDVVLTNDEVARIDAMPLAGYSGEHPNRQTVPAMSSR